MQEGFETINVCSTVEYVAVSKFLCTITGLEETLRVESFFGLGRILRYVSFLFFFISRFLTESGIIICTVKTS
jgi:hypothetical protein